MQGPGSRQRTHLQHRITHRQHALRKVASSHELPHQGVGGCRRKEHRQRSGLRMGGLQKMVARGAAMEAGSLAQSSCRPPQQAHYSPCGLLCVA